MALSAIKQVSTEALVEVQSVLDSLRRPDEEAPRAPAPSLRDIAELVRRAEATGLAVVVSRPGRPAPRSRRGGLPDRAGGADRRGPACGRGAVSIPSPRRKATRCVVDDDGDGGPAVPEMAPSAGATASAVCAPGLGARRSADRRTKARRRSDGSPGARTACRLERVPDDPGTVADDQALVRAGFRRCSTPSPTSRWSARRATAGRRCG